MVIVQHAMAVNRNLLSMLFFKSVLYLYLPAHLLSHQPTASKRTIFIQKPSSTAAQTSRGVSRQGINLCPCLVRHRHYRLVEKHFNLFKFSFILEAIFVPLPNHCTTDFKQAYKTIK